MHGQKKTMPTGFDTATGLPDSDERAHEWQEANRRWWEDHPMRYDWHKRLSQDEFGPEFYAEIDRRFLASAAHYMPWHQLPFDPLIDFDSLRYKDVLEIGVGNGTHAQLLARHAKNFVGIDLTGYAVKSVSRRLRLSELPGAIIHMDAENMAFESNSFDFIWSWGVIHHSSNTKKILQEMHRVLRPGGTATVMVYHRSFWNKYILAGLIHGVARGQFLKGKSIHSIMQEETDGAIARYYSENEWRNLAANFFQVVSVQIVGQKTDILPLPVGRIKEVALGVIPDSASRFLTNTCGFGSFLVCTLKKTA